ncbi:MAG: sigma-70 family RNA polymerase sigma factor [Planctomycetota bacterium]
MATVMQNSSSTGNKAGFPSREEVLHLIEAARAGDTEQLGQLLQFYFNYLTVLASTQLDHRLRKRLNPSDLVQETMMAAHRDFQAFRGNSPQELVGWLRQILINVLHGAIAKHVKAGKRDIRREVSIDQVVSNVDRSAANLASILPGRIDSPSSPVHNEERAANLAEHLAQLRPDYREVIVLRNLKGLSFDEIAEEMERTSGAVRMLWLRAIDKFKDTFENAGNETLH